MAGAAAEQRAAVDVHDRFSFVYFAWIMLACLLFTSGPDLDRIFNLYLLLVPLLYLLALAVAIYWVVALIRNTVLGRWRRVLSVLAAPAAAYLLFAGAGAVGVTSERIRLEIGKRSYADEIAKLAQTDGPRFRIFDWGQSGGAGVPNFIYTLIYDESDEISLSGGERSRAWQERANKLCPGTIMCSILNPPSDFSVAAKRIEGHFYLVTLAW